MSIETTDGIGRPVPEDAPKAPAVANNIKVIVVFALLAAAVFSLLIYIPAVMQFIEVVLLAVIALQVSRHYPSLIFTSGAEKVRLPPDTFLIVIWLSHVGCDDPSSNTGTSA